MLDARLALAERAFAAITIGRKRGLLDDGRSFANDGVVLRLGGTDLSIGGRAIALATVHNPFRHSLAPTSAEA